MTATVLKFRGNPKPAEPMLVPAQVFILPVHRPPDFFDMCAAGAAMFAIPLFVFMAPFNGE
jgi:hypothetical protein